MFKKESKKALVTNQDFDWTGAHTVKVYKISTGEYERLRQSRNRQRDNRFALWIC